MPVSGVRTDTTKQAGSTKKTYYQLMQLSLFSMSFLVV